MITALISFQLVKFIIGLLILVLFTFLIFAGILMFKSNDLDKMFTKSQKEQLDSLLNIYMNLYLIDKELDEENKDKIKGELLVIQTDVMLLAEYVAGKSGLYYVQSKMESLKTQKL